MHERACDTVHVARTCHRPRGTNVPPSTWQVEFREEWVETLAQRLCFGLTTFLNYVKQAP